MTKLAWLWGASAVAVTMTLGVTSAYAQDVDAGDLEEVVVTGSRLRSGFTAPTPVTTASAEQLQAASPVSISEALNQLPVFKNSSRAQNASSSAVRGNGASFLSLRGLEPQRTLVLLDGRRFVSSSATGAPDINLFPSDLVSRVEVVTGGASAAYGSDAVAGVVNFILDRKFAGVRASAQAGISDYKDGETFRSALTFGHGWMDERGHFIGSLEYSKQNTIGPPGGRDWAEAGWAIITNPAAPPTRLIAQSRSSQATFGGLIVGGPLDGIQFLPGGLTAPFVKGTAVTSTTMIGGDGASTPLALTSGLERYNAFGRATFEASDKVHVFLEGGYGEVTSDYSITNSTQTGPNAFTIFADNAFLPADVRARMTAQNVASFRLGRVNRDWGQARAESTSKTWRVVGGLNWDLGSGWDVDAYYMHGSNNYLVKTKDDPIHRNLFAAADAVRSPTTGQIVCRSTLQGLDPGCVPINLFGEGAPSAAALAYVRGTAVQDLTLKEDVFSVSLRGSPFSTWAGSVNAAAGFEYRREQADQTSDILSRTVVSNVGVRGLPAGFVGQLGSYFLSNPQPLSGGYNIREVFAEAEAPLAKDLAWAKSLSVNGAVRLIDYSTVGRVTTWKVGASYEPIADLRLRGTRSRDIRAANIAELFSPAVSTQGSVFVNNVNTPWLGKRKGNPNLEPEIADTTTVGLVYRPSWLPRFDVSVDYFDIDLKGAVTQLTAQQTVDQCAVGSAAACSQLTNVPGQQLILNIATLNVAKIKTSGIDYEVGYQTPLADGQLRMRVLVSYLAKLATTFPGTAPIDRAGDIGTTGTPEWSGTLSASYSRGPLELYMQERFIGPGRVDVTAGRNVFADNKVGSVFYADATVRYAFRLADREMQAFLTVNNLFNRNPPIVPTIPFGSYRATNFSLYDVLGRYYTVGLKARF